MMRQIALLSGLMLLPCPTQAQAPPWTDLWRVASGTLTEPAALATGPAATFWNAAAVMGPSRIAGGVEVYQIPDAVNVSGVLLGANYRVGKTLAVGVIAGRLAVGDLVRTSTSPASEGSDIQVYSQFAGGTVGTQTGPLALGTTLLLHDARLDGTREGGVTLDVGARLTPIAHLTVGAATHLGDPIVTGGAATEYLLGAEYGFPIPSLFGAAAHTRIRYGFTLRDGGGTEHLGSGGLLLADRLLVNAGVVWSSGYGTGAWQPVIGVALRAGPYRVGITRGSGVSGIGAAYRITLGFGDPL